MAKLDIATVYEDRIKEIEKQQKQAVFKKNWSKYYHLKAEKDNLELIIKQIEVKKYEKYN